MSNQINEEHPGNADVLKALSAQAVEKTSKNSSQWDIDSFELHTHPDLMERFHSLANSLPKGFIRVANYGCPMLITENGIVFAFTSGMSQVTLRLPDGPTIPTTNIAFDLKPPWYSFNPRSEDTEPLKQEMRRAFEEAVKI